jgi:hypothetical protein
MTALLNLIGSGEVVNEIPAEPWVFGVATAGGLIVILYILTRFNPKR